MREQAADRVRSRQPVSRAFAPVSLPCTEHRPMSYFAWVLFIGVLLVVTSMAAGVLRRGPTTTFPLSLAAGIAVGPAVLGLARVSFDHDSAGWLRAVTETG